MYEIRDANGHLACKADAGAGIVEYATKLLRITAGLPVGGWFKVEFKGAVTSVERTDKSVFCAKSVAMKK